MFQKYKTQKVILRPISKPPQQKSPVYINRINLLGNSPTRPAQQSYQTHQARTSPQQFHHQIQASPPSWRTNKGPSPQFHQSSRNSVSPGSQIHGYTSPNTPTLSSSSISPMSGQVINEWEQSIKQKTSPIALPSNVLLNNNIVKNGASPPQICRLKREETSGCEKNLSHIPNHIAIVGKPGLVVLNSSDKLVNSNNKKLKPKPIHTTRPIIKQTPAQPSVNTAMQCVIVSKLQQSLILTDTI